MKLYDLKKPFLTALVVGSILSIINQGSHILSLSLTKTDLLRIFCNFLVPFLVATYSRASLINELNEQKENAENQK